MYQWLMKKLLGPDEADGPMALALGAILIVLFFAGGLAAIGLIALAAVHAIFR